jgi:NADH:ubiquinone oxidoreductase subunit 4 (subunit M)
LGTYAILRFIIPLFPAGILYLSPLFFVLSILGIIYASLSALRQVDLKKIVAYSSIAHMNFVMLGIFSMNLQGLEGSLFLMFSHALVSSALFICVGFLYDRYKTRIILYYSGLTQLMPLFSSIFFIFILSNLSFPGTSSFIGEFLVLVGCFAKNNVVSF